MKTLIFTAAALLLAGCASQPEVRYIPVEHREVAERKPITVTDCHGKLADIYSDSRMTILMPNPFMPDSDGRYIFWAAHNVCAY